MVNSNLHPWMPKPDLQFRSPRRAWYIPPLVDAVGPLFSRLALGLEKIDLENPDGLADLWQEIYQKKGRLLIAFRHCGDADPHGVYLALNSLLKKTFSSRGLSSHPPFLVLSSAEIALWGSPFETYILERASTLSLAHGPLGRSALSYLRGHLETSSVPVVLAPEGQITYEREAPVVLDSGIGSMALWAREAVPSGTPVYVLPLGVRYQAPRETWARWGRFVSQMEKSLGFSSIPPSESPRNRLLGLWSGILKKTEVYYHHYHGVTFSYKTTGSLDVQGLEDRKNAVLNAALGVLCGAFGLDATAPPRQLIFQVRSRNLEVVAGGTGGSELERNLRHRACAEAYWVGRHQELADILLQLDPRRLPANPTLDQAIEAALNLADVLGRFQGETVAARPRYFRRQLVLTPGEPLDVPDRGGTSRKDFSAMILEKVKLSLELLSRPRGGGESRS